MRLASWQRAILVVFTILALLILPAIVSVMTMPKAESIPVYREATVEAQLRWSQVHNHICATEGQEACSAFARSLRCNPVQNSCARALVREYQSRIRPLLSRVKQLCSNLGGTWRNWQCMKQVTTCEWKIVWDGTWQRKFLCWKKWVHI